MGLGYAQRRICTGKWEGGQGWGGVGGQGPGRAVGLFWGQGLASSPTGTSRERLSRGRRG